MSELKNKILVLLICILSSFLVTILVIFNISIYNKETKNLYSKINMIISINNEYDKKDNFNPMIIETDIYEIVLNDYNQIERIVSYSPNGLSDLNIRKIVNNNINKINNKKNLYINDYVFMFNKNGNLFMINNISIKKYLLKELNKSFLIFIILEIFIVLFANKITKWIVKPVEDSFAKQKQFIYDASHELKTPIAIISASVETLEKNPSDSKWLDNIKEENEQMGKLVTNLLDLSKSENIREKEEYKNNNLSKLIEKKALSFESLMYENNLELVTNIDKDIMFNCNGDRIRELLSILVDNAIKHSDKNSNIEVCLKKEKKDIILSVTNKGEEIPISERDKIFERFYRIDKSRNRKEFRYGLGLSIAKNIVINHNGIIKVDCKDGYTTFKVVFKEK